MLDTLRPSHSAPASDQRKAITRRWLPRLIAIAAIALAAFLLYHTLRGYSFDDIVASLRALSTSHLGLAFAFAAGSYFCLTGFDWLATRYVREDISWPYAALTSFCSLSLGHNIGLAALSSGAIRYRFYTRAGVSAENVAKIILFCAVTVGLGLLLLGGLALLWRPELGRTITGLPTRVVTGLAVSCLAIPAIYVALAATLRARLRIRSWSIALPPLRLALAQIAIGTANFACVAACLYSVLAGARDASYVAVATVYVIGNIASLITHVPGGLGVIETVVQHLLPRASTIGALIAFRVIYYLVPLFLGGVLLAISEVGLGRAGRARHR
jgi:uncharacterized membrane protein YbhN (UPF0104 family)